MLAVGRGHLAACHHVDRAAEFAPSSQSGSHPSPILPAQVA
jgi:hypothetical protein